MSPSCFGDPGLKGAPTISVDLVLERPHALRELARHAGEDVAVDRDPAPLHARQDLDERTLEPLVDRRHLLGDEPRPEDTLETQRDVGLLGAIFARLFDRRARESLKVAARAGDFAEGIGL